MMKTSKLLTVSKTGIAIVALLLTMNVMNAKAQQKDQPVTGNLAARLIRYEVRPEFQLVFRKAVSDYIMHSVSSETNILSEAFYEQDKPSVLWIIERWNNKKALEKISKSSWFRSIDSLSRHALIKPAESFYVKDLEPLSKQQWRSSAQKGDKPVIVMLFVDSKPGTENDFKKLYHTAMPLFRSEPGVINYQLSQFTDDSTRFVTYEKFRNEDAFQYHLHFPPIKAVLDYLHTSIKKQPFETGLHKLIVFAPIIPE